MSQKTVHELIDNMSPVHAKIALQQIASYCEDDARYVSSIDTGNIMWIIEETTVNFDGLVEAFSKQGNELKK